MGELGNCAVCGADATARYPLLSGEPAFCSTHHNPKDAESFGCDFSGPDDFDIPDDFDVEEPVWVTQEGKVFYDESEIEDDHLINIVRFLRRRAQEAEVAGQGDYAFALEDKLEEMEEYARQRGLLE